MSDDELNPNKCVSNFDKKGVASHNSSMIEPRLSFNSSQSSQYSNYSDMLEKNTRMIFKYPDG